MLAGTPHPIVLPDEWTAPTDVLRIFDKRIYIQGGQNNTQLTVGNVCAVSRACYPLLPPNAIHLLDPGDGKGKKRGWSRRLKQEAAKLREIREMFAAQMRQSFIAADTTVCYSWYPHKSSLLLLTVP